MQPSGRDCLVSRPDERIPFSDTEDWHKLLIVERRRRGVVFSILGVGNHDYEQCGCGAIFQRLEKKYAVYDE